MTNFQHSSHGLRFRFRDLLGSHLCFLQTATPNSETPSRSFCDDRYRLTPFRTFVRSALEGAPRYWRDRVAEFCLRREGAPGPASEHVFQYLLDAKNRDNRVRGDGEATVAKGADIFYERQYRQYLNATMGVFAMTARLALLGCGGVPRHLLWSRRRPVYTAMVGEADGAPPIIVLDHQTVAVPVLLPTPADAEEEAAIDQWLGGVAPMPRNYQSLVEGDEVRCATPRARARRRHAVAALIEVVDAVRCEGKLAILALHPYDPDAMGLHITLFATQALTAEAVEREYGIASDFLHPWRHAAWNRSRLLRFCVGGIEEVFTQCSQNLFIKRPVGRPEGSRRAAWPCAWSPAQPLERILAAQFELLQITVSASGLPGASPRNGDIGKAAFVARRDSKTIILIPYFAGNAVHGHAAKLWSNAQGALAIWDDHTSLSAVTITGPSRVVDHEWVERRFPNIASEVATRQKRNGTRAPDPEYWFEQEVAEILQQDEPLPASVLDPMRPTCSISAAGRALHGKKPAYFAADTLASYDQAWQHEREAEGRRVDPSGVAHRYWERESAPALAARLSHLENPCRQP